MRRNLKHYKTNIITFGKNKEKDYVIYVIFINSKQDFAGICISCKSQQNLFNWEVLPILFETYSNSFNVSIIEYSNVLILENRF